MRDHLTEFVLSPDSDRRRRINSISGHALAPFTPSFVADLFIRSAAVDAIFQVRCDLIPLCVRQLIVAIGSEHGRHFSAAENAR